MSPTETELGSLQHQAQAWWMRLHSGEATRADADAFRQWATRSAAHAQAWRETMRVWSSLDPLLAEEAARLALPARKPARLFSWQGMSHALQSPGRRAFLGGAVAASVTAGVVAVYPPLGLWPSVEELAADYRTGTGEQRQLALGRDVNVQMNTQTVINRVGTGGGAGAETVGLELVAGEAEIALDGSASFFVDAGGGRLQARVARINVRYTGPQVCVTCLEGRVTVSVAGQRRMLEQGSQLFYDKSGMQEPVGADLAGVGAWRTGVLSFDRMQLSEVIAEINRYRPGKIFLRNDELGRTQVRMQIALRSIDNAPAMIHELYGARMRSLPGGIVVLS
ncbi:FecR domain-containing protein [Variovorax paradoxus]|uniref:FecR family protein n=1 Tax=Variovorax paradoxus TaxID=34073 RepID=UPI0021AC59B8|nr:FecR domain-containing protein [Variovorax paradoxus]UVH57833.1 FecR domain-containing protein [Variovorax paradoxus]